MTRDRERNPTVIDPDELKPYMDAVMNNIDALTPEVSGMTRTEVVAFAVTAYFTGAAAALDLGTMLPIDHDDAEKIYARPDGRAFVAGVFNQVADSVVARAEGE